jgi:thiamine-phosphate pyrophosphorylase
MREDFPPVYVILDASLLPCPVEEIAEQLAESGVALLQYRDKFSSVRKTFDICKRLVITLRPWNARLIVNDRADVAALADAGGTHAGQDDLDVESARMMCPPPMWVGVSTHNLQQLSEAALTSADYIAFGPVFPTQTKANPDPVVGLDLLRQARQMTSKPLVAIGGITVDNAAVVFAAGADCVAVIRDVLAAANPTARVHEFLRIAASARAK